MWQVIAPDTAPAPVQNPTNDKIEFGIWIALATIFGGFLKSFFDFLLGRGQARISKSKADSDIDVSKSTITKNENEVIVNLQRLLMEMQDKLDHWISRFEGTVEEAQEVEQELQKVRRLLHDAIEGRRDYYEAVGAVIHLLDQIAPLLRAMANAEGNELVGILQVHYSKLTKLQEGYDAHPITMPAATEIVKK